MEDMLRVGVITSTHGIAGEVKVFPTTDDPNRFKQLKEAVIRTKREDIPVHINGVKFFKNMVLLRFKEFDNINEVERFRQADLMVTRENAVPLEEGQYFLCDLMGLTALDDEGNCLGKITDILQTGANDVYEITDDSGKSYLFPGIPDCLLKVSLEEGTITFHVMKGLMD